MLKLHGFMACRFTCQAAAVSAKVAFFGPLLGSGRKASCKPRKLTIAQVPKKELCGGQGSIRRPQMSEMFFLPQKPYMSLGWHLKDSPFWTCERFDVVAFPRPLGDLRSQLLYPSEPGEVAARPVRSESMDAHIRLKKNQIRLHRRWRTGSSGRFWATRTSKGSQGFCWFLRPLDLCKIRFTASPRQIRSWRSTR